MRRHKVKKTDPLLNAARVGNVTHEQIYHALRPLDEMVHRMELRWGADRLPGLVDVDTAARFGSAKAKLDAAITDNDVEAVKKRVKVMLRAWKSLDGLAAEAGHRPIDPEVWTVKIDDGAAYAFVQSNAEAWKTTKELRDCRVFSIEEVARLLDAQCNLIGAVKDEFPDAKVVDARKREPLDDEIPF